MPNEFYKAPSSEDINSRYYSQQNQTPTPSPAVETQQQPSEKKSFFDSYINNFMSEEEGTNPVSAGVSALGKTIIQKTVTPPSEDKSFMRKVGEDAVALGAGIPIALAHPIDTLKSMFTTEEQKYGGATVESVKQIFQPEYYKEHPLLAAFNTGTWASSIGTFGLSRVLGGIVQKGSAAAIEQAVKEAGVKSAATAARTALADSSLKVAVKQAVKSGEIGIVKETAKSLLTKKGFFDEATATRLAETVKTSIESGMKESTSKIGVYNRLAHPIDTLGEGVSKIWSPVAKKVFGEPEKSAVGRLYGSDIVSKDPQGFASIEEWAGQQVVERGLKNTVDNRQSIMNEWASTVSEWSLLTPEQKVAYHNNYIEASKFAQKINSVTDEMVVPTKFLSPNSVDAIVTTIKDAPKGESVSETLAALEEIYGNDITLHKESISKVINANPTKEALIGAIESLGKRHTLDNYYSKDLNSIVKQMEDQTGYRLTEAPRGKPVSYAAPLDNTDAFTQVGITSAQPSNPVVSQVLAEGESLYQAGRINDGLAKLQEATNITKDSLVKNLNDGATEIVRLETNTHGLYFGTPEPSYWVNIKTSNIPETLASLADFAKKNNQDSFIMATKIGFDMEGNYGVTLKFGKTLTNEDVLTIERVANENGIGLTLNQKTGEAVAYNIPEFDSMNAESFLDSAGKTWKALKESNYKLQFSIDKFNLKVYAKETYDDLISKSTTIGERSPASISAGERGGISSGAEQTSAGIGGISGQQPAVGQYTSSLSPEASNLIAAKTKLGKLFDNLGLSASGGVEGTLENLYADQFTQRLVKDLGAKYPDGIKISVKDLHTGEIAGYRTVPLEKIYSYLDRNKMKIQESASKFIETRYTISDISAKDLQFLGIEKKLAEEIVGVARDSMLPKVGKYGSLPFSQTGLMEGFVNLFRAKVPGFNSFVNLKFETHFNLNPFYAMRFWYKTQLLKSMNLKNFSVSFGERLDSRLQPIVKNIPYLGDVVAPKIDLTEIKLMSDEVLYGINKNVVDFASNPELISLEKSANIGKSIQSRNVFLRGVGYNIPYDATGFAKAISKKYGMELREALGYQVKNGIKTYNNPEVFNLIKDSIQSVFHYEPGFLTSPLMKSMNTIWFPIRFETKVVKQTARWLGNLSPISKIEIMSNWTHFSNWIQTTEGQEYTKKYRSQWESLADFFLPYKAIGETVGSVLEGKLFNGKTGMIGGLPFGFIVNIMQDLSIVPESEQKNPITGKSTKKVTPKKLISESSAITIVEDFLVHILPSLPLYTWLGGTVDPFRTTIDSIVKGSFATGESLMTGESPKKIKKRIDRQSKNVKPEYTRFK